jgi:hypothetical protein
MNKNELLLRHSRRALGIGGVLGLYTSLTMFWQMSYEWWLAIHNLLVITSFLLTALAGYEHRKFRCPFHFMVLSIVLFFAIIMLFYIGAYVITTSLFADKMVWIPFFYRDYNHHGFRSIVDYLNYNNNERELLKLQAFSFSMSYVLYFMAGNLGYGINAMIDKIRGHSDMAPYNG